MKAVVRFATIVATAFASLAFSPMAFATGQLPHHETPCVNGFAEGYPCNKVNLHGHLTATQLRVNSGGFVNDSWGWTDPDNGKEYALVGMTNGTAFVDISGEDPVLLGNLATHSSNNTWRDIKTMGHYAYIVSEATDHGMQVFDLYHLRNLTGTPLVTFTEDAWYGQFGRAHNIVINEDSGFAYAVGSRQGTEQCAAGLHMINISNPLVPTFAGCFSADGYTHDAQCIIYDGPDTNYSGREICFNANEDTLTIVDVTNKAAPVQLSRTSYAGVGYTHQGWLTADRRHFLVDDETDEINQGHNTYTFVWDVQSLTAPTVAFTYIANVASSDHNLYTHNGYAYAANYKSGLRILDLGQIDSGSLNEVAYFDTYPSNDTAGTSGAWSNYPFFASGKVVISDTGTGMFVVEPDLCSAPAVTTDLTANANGANRIDLAWTAGSVPNQTYAIDRTLGGCAGTQTDTIATGLANAIFSDTTASGQVTYGYRVRAVAPSGECSAAPSQCVEASTSGVCTAAPQFSGIGSASSPGTSACAINLGWTAAQSSCAGPSTYSVFRSTDPAFTPAPANRISAGIAGTSSVDSSPSSAIDYNYIVRATDSSNNATDSNLFRLSARAFGPVADGDWISGAETGDPTLSGVDFIDGPGGNAPVPSHVAWEVVSDVAHSGSRSFFSSYNASECLALRSEPITLTAGQSPMLDFWTRYDIEAGWDGGVVQISTNDGGTWTTITPTGGYPSVFSHNGNANACGFPNGTGAYTGTNLTWTHPTFNLAAYAGQTVRLRWQFSTDGAVEQGGWWLDDLRMTHAQIPGMCNADTIFSHGFE
ncbi:MAG: choice-of-anchor B family protein [Dokdonella sp.]